MSLCKCVLVTQSRPTLRPHQLQPTRLLHPWDLPGKSTGVGCHCLLCSHWSRVLKNLETECTHISTHKHTHTHTSTHRLTWVLCVLMQVCVSQSVASNSLRPHQLQPTRLLYPWDFPGKDTGVGSHFLLQEIFPARRSNPDLLHCRQILYHLSHQGSPLCVLEWHKKTGPIATAQLAPFDSEVCQGEVQKTQ